MNYLKCIGFLCLIGLSVACAKQKELSQTEALEQLEEQFLAIEKMAQSKTCTDSTDWKFTAYGSKACGGPMGYIAYSKKIDTDLFLEKVKQYDKDQADYNENWDIFSDCSVPNQPDYVACKNGEALLVY